MNPPGTGWCSSWVMTAESRSFGVQVHLLSVRSRKLTHSNAVGMLLGYGFVNDGSSATATTIAHDTETAASTEAVGTTPQKTTSKRKGEDLIPDYAVLMKENGEARVVGEARNHNFQTLWKDLTQTPEQWLLSEPLVCVTPVTLKCEPIPDSLTITSPGQIVNYMIERNLRYGLLTTTNTSSSSRQFSREREMDRRHLLLRANFVRRTPALRRQKDIGPPGVVLPPVRCSRGRLAC